MRPANPCLRVPQGHMHSSTAGELTPQLSTIFQETATDNFDDYKK